MIIVCCLFAVVVDTVEVFGSHLNHILFNSCICEGFLYFQLNSNLDLKFYSRPTGC